MRIGQAIATQTLLVSIGFILLTLLTISSWTKIESGQQSLGENSLALSDYELLEASVKSWFVLNDLIYASGTTHLVGGALRQADHAIATAQSLQEFPLTSGLSDLLSSIVERLNTNQSWLRDVQYLSPSEQAQEYNGYLERWDKLSPQVLELLEQYSQELKTAAEIFAKEVQTKRESFLLTTAVSYLMFALLVIALWRWLTRTLVKPLHQLTVAADSALLTGEPLAMGNAGPQEVTALTNSFNAFAQTLEHRVDERTSQLQKRQEELVSEMTLRKQAEKEAQQAAKTAIAANETKGQFLATMSHEIRTPLNGIIGSTDMLLKAAHNSKTTRGLKIIQSSSSHLLHLLTMVLDFSKAEARQLKLSPEEFSFNTLLNELRSIFAARAEEKDIELVFDIDPSIENLLHGDSLHIKQVLVNLLGNALTYTERGSVTLRARAEQQTQDDEVNLLWEIKDTGIGIPEAEKQAIFDSFHQIDRGVTRRYGGTGLGLSISQQLTVLMGGDIQLLETSPQGSTFSCNMKVRRLANTPMASLAQAQRVILAVDSPGHRAVLEHSLQNMGVHLVDDLSKFNCTELSASPSEPKIIVLMDQAMENTVNSLLSEWRANAVDTTVVRTISLVNPFDESLNDRSEEQSTTSQPSVLTLPILPHELRVTLLGRMPNANQATAQMPARFIGHVLVAEDNPINQEVIEMMLSEMGIDVTLAGDGQAAVDLMKVPAPGYDLILMDWHMPVLDGLSAARLIRDLEKTNGLRATPILAATADSRSEAWPACEEAGMDGMLAKPFTFEDLHHAMALHLRPATLAGSFVTLEEV